MSRDLLPSKIKRILKKEYGDKGERIVLRPGFDDNLHLYIISKKFKGLRPKLKEDKIWPILFRELERDEWGRITLTMGLAPDEINSSIPELYNVRLK